MIEMSRDVVRFVALVLCSSTVAAAAAGWVATGALPFSRSPSGDAEPATEVAVEAEGEADPFSIFDETGVNEGFEELESVEQVFAIGLLPGGPKDPVSVVSVAGLAGAAMVFVLVLTRGRGD